MEQVFHGVPCEVLRNGQNQCPSWKNFQLPADSIRIHPRSMGKATRIHPCLPTPRDGRLADPLKLLQRANFHIQSPHRCCCQRSLLLTHSQWSYGSRWEDGLLPGLEWRQTPTPRRWHAYHGGNGYAARKIGSPNKMLGRARCQKRTPYGTVQSLNSHIPCEVCENFGHSGNDCLKTREDALNNNNGFCPQGGLGWNQSHPPYQEGNFAYNSNFANQPSLIDLMLWQAQINENLTKKLASNDEIF